MTYNHCNYIKKCLDGIVQQKTNFKFVALIHDDCSIDGTIEIIREYANKYPQIIKPIYEAENQYKKHDGSLDIIKRNALVDIDAKYIAMCEGDDYWTDPYKLQKQVSFLEAHPDYAMCYTRVKQYKQCISKYINDFGGPLETFDDILQNNTIPTLSVLMRFDVYMSYLKEIKPECKGWSMGDYPVWLYFSAMSKIKFIPDTTGTYRILPNSLSHCEEKIKMINFGLCYREIAHYFSLTYSNKQMQKITKNNLDWILFIKYCFINECDNAKKVARDALFSKQNSYLKNILFLIGIFSPTIVKRIYSWH